MKLLKKLLKGILACILIAAVIVGVYLVQAYVIDKDKSKDSASTSASEGKNGKNSSGKSNGSNGKNSGANSSNVSGSNGTNPDGSENGLNGPEGFEYNGIPTNGENGNNGSTNGSGNGSNGGSSSNSSSNSSTTGTLGEKAQSFGQKAMSALKKGWKISVSSFKEGYHSVPDYNTYNFDDRFLFYEGTQNQDIVLHIIDLLIEDSDNNLFSKPTLKLRNFGGDRTIEYTTLEEYKSELQDAKGAVTNGNYDVSFGYSALHVYVDEIIITK